MVAASVEAIVPVAYPTENKSSEDFWEAVETLADRIEQLRQKVASLLDAAGDVWRTATNQSPWAVDFKLSLMMNQMNARLKQRKEF